MFDISAWEQEEQLSALRTKIKIRIGVDETEDTHDGLIDVLIQDALSFCLTYTGRAESIPELDHVVIGLVVQKWIRLGNEGISSYRLGDLSITYKDTPREVYAQLNRLRKVKRVSRS